MAIKVINEIPGSDAKKSSRKQIEEDIKEAIEKGIPLFEFTGDYNYKYLAQYAAEVAKKIRDEKIREVHKKFRRENLTDDERNIKGFYIWFKSTWEYKKEWITISSRKGEDHRRVFCKIDDVKAFEEKIIEDCKKELAEARTEFVLKDGKWEWIKKRKE